MVRVRMPARDPYTALQQQLTRALFRGSEEDIRWYLERRHLAEERETQTGYQVVLQPAWKRRWRVSVCRGERLRFSVWIASDSALPGQMVMNLLSWALEHRHVSPLAWDGQTVTVRDVWLACRAWDG